MSLRQVAASNPPPMLSRVDGLVLLGPLPENMLLRASSLSLVVGGCRTRVACRGQGVVLPEDVVGDIAARPGRGGC